MSGGNRYTNRLHAEATRWQHVAGEPTAADAAGPYSHEQLVRMDADLMLEVLNLPFTARSGITRALARTMAKSFSARFRH
jgi:hypothetical protein